MISINRILELSDISANVYKKKLDQVKANQQIQQAAKQAVVQHMNTQKPVQPVANQQPVKPQPPTQPVANQQPVKPQPQPTTQPVANTQPVQQTVAAKLSKNEKNNPIIKAHQDAQQTISHAQGYSDWAKKQQPSQQSNSALQKVAPAQPAAPVVNNPAQPIKSPVVPVQPAAPIKTPQATKPVQAQPRPNVPVPNTIKQAQAKNPIGKQATSQKAK